eukprot:scaffold8052_cov14-Tisochrysis_lutea.AAC.2
MTADTGCEVLSDHQAVFLDGLWKPYASLRSSVPALALDLEFWSKDHAQLSVLLALLQLEAKAWVFLGTLTQFGSSGRIAWRAWIWATPLQVGVQAGQQQAQLCAERHCVTS